MNDKGFLSAQEAADAAGGRLISCLKTNPLEKNISSICIDSRKAVCGSLFFALKGENLDGHDFIADAVSRGAVCVVAEKECEEVMEMSGSCKCLFIIAENPLKALQKLAGYYRNLFKNIFIIGVTGSSGKTTTKELISAILGKEAPVVMNEGNMNSETGLPLSVFKINSTHRFGVFEMGINHPGEMDDLVEILKPDYAVLTNIGTAHIGLMGSKDAIAKEKSKIFTSENIKAGIILEEDSYAAEVKEKFANIAGFFGEKSTDNLISIEDKGLSGSVLKFKQGEIRFPLIGKYNCKNALAAVKTAEFLNISFNKIKEGLESISPLFGRGQIIHGNVTVISDCYNSNLESAAAAMAFLENLPWKGKKAAVLGSVLELGNDSDSIHDEILGIALNSRIEGVFFFGNSFSNAWKNRCRDNCSEKHIFWSISPEALERKIAEFLEPGDIVLFKGSRGMALERFIDPVLKTERKVINC